MAWLNDRQLLSRTPPPIAGGETQIHDDSPSLCRCPLRVSPQHRSSARLWASQTVRVLWTRRAPSASRRPWAQQAERPFRSCARRPARIRRWARRRSRQPARFADASIAHCEHQLRSTASPSFGQTIDVRRSVRVRRRAGRWRRQRPRCSRRRGISSTKLQGRKRLSSCSAKMPSQASLQAPVEPGIANR